MPAVTMGPGTGILQDSIAPRKMGLGDGHDLTQRPTNFLFDLILRNETCITSTSEDDAPFMVFEKGSSLSDSPGLSNILVTILIMLSHQTHFSFGSKWSE